MDTVKIEFEFPKEIFFQLNNTVTEFKSEILNSIAVDFYSKGKLTLKQAADLAGLCKTDFIKVLSFHNCSLFNWDENEINKELDEIDDLVDKLKK